MAKFMAWLLTLFAVANLILIFVPGGGALNIAGALIDVPAAAFCWYLILTEQV